MHDCPSPRVGPGGCLHTIRHNFEIPIGEVPLARDRFPLAAFHLAIVVAAVFSGKLVGAVHLNRLWRLRSIAATSQKVRWGQRTIQPVLRGVRFD